MATTGTDAARRARDFWTVVAMTALAGTAGSESFDDGNFSGAVLFYQFCAGGLVPQGRGDGPVAPTLSVAVPDLSRLAERNGGAFPAADVREVIDGRAVVVAHGPR